MAKSKKSKNCSPRAEMEELLAIGKTLGLNLKDAEKSGSELNFLGVRTGTTLLSRRLDSKTFFVQDFRYKVDEGHGLFNGSDDALKEMGAKIIEALGIPKAETASWDVLVENTQIAQVKESGKFEFEQPEAGAKTLRIERKVDGLPVWSSNLTLRLTSKGSIAFLQAHWPDLSPTVVEEGCRLEYLVKDKCWQPPPQQGASPESMQAGIMHSVPISFVMDVQPAIRVIYEPWNQLFGRKLRVYFDRHGRKVPDARHAEALPELIEKQRLSDKGDASHHLH